MNFILGQAFNCGTLITLIVISLLLEMLKTRPLHNLAFVNANTPFVGTPTQSKAKASRP